MADELSVMERDDLKVLEAVEILEPDTPRPVPEPIRVTALTRPFNFERTTLDVTGRFTIRELLRQAGIGPNTATLVYLNGVLVPERGYDFVRPKPGTHVLVRVVPRGGRTGSVRAQHRGSSTCGSSRRPRWPAR
jgi:hypothetical protein